MSNPPNKIEKRITALNSEINRLNDYIKTGKQMINSIEADRKKPDGELPLIIKLIDKIKAGVSKTGSFLFNKQYPFAHYATLIIIIIIIIIILTVSFTAVPNKKASKEKNTGIRGFINKIKFEIKKFFSNIFGYKFRSLRMSENSKKQGGTSRKTVSGRCDMLDWMEKGNMCIKTNYPAPIRWILPVDKMPELSEIPTKLKEELTDNGNKLVIDIPYSKVNTKFVPNCSKMTYYNGKKVDGLLKQKNINSDLCMIVEKKSKKYKNNYKRYDNQVYNLCK